jgi:hypothetical protein
MSTPIYIANEKYYAETTQEYNPGDTTIYLTPVPDEVPTILVFAKDTINETVFTCTGKTINSITGVTRLRGANVELLTQTPVTCLNNAEFINQYRSYLGMSWKGTYDNDTAYEIQDGVNYNGSSYICIAETTGNLPTDTDYWQLLTSKGDTGATGAAGTDGTDGEDGLGVPAGGSTAQILRKIDGTDNNTEWSDQPYNSSMARQAIINGNFDVWQRGTSFTASGYTADRWIMQRSVASCTTTQQAFTLGQTDVPLEPRYYIRNVVTTAASARDYAYLSQRIEGVRSFAGQTVTLSFYAKCGAAKNISVEFAQLFGSGGSPSAPVTAIGVSKKTLTTSWAKYTVTASIPSISGKTLGTDNSDSLWMIIWMDAGSNYNARTDSLGHQSDTFEIAQVQLCAGNVALPFMPKSYNDELRACQRYCHITTTAVANEIIGLARAYSTTEAQVLIELPNVMRIVPTLIISNVADFILTDSVAGADSTNIVIIGTSSKKTVVLTVTVASGLTQYRAYSFNSDSTVGRYLGFSAEL